MSNDPTLSPSLAAELADLKRRLDNLERSPKVPFSSTRGGVFSFLDEDGNLRFALGNETGLDGSINGITTVYGAFGHGDGNAIAFALREGDRGLTYPIFPVPLHDVVSKVVTSGSFVGLWECNVDFPALEVLNIRGAVQSDVGTTGELRIVDSFSGINTNVLTIPSNTNSAYSFEWIHPASVGLYDDRPRLGGLALAVHARRTGGAGNLTVFQPSTAELTSIFLVPSATSTGHPQLA